MDSVRNSCSPSGSRKNRSSRITPRSASAAERAIGRAKGTIGERHGPIHSTLEKSLFGAIFLVSSLHTTTCNYVSRNNFALFHNTIETAQKLWNSNSLRVISMRSWDKRRRGQNPLPSFWALAGLEPAIYVRKPPIYIRNGVTLHTENQYSKLVIC